MRTIKLTIAYDGTAYHGFQRQLNALAIQQILEEKLAKLFGHKLVLNGAGRTDTGVHAAGQVVSFSTTGTIPAERICRAAASLLPSDIVILAAEDVPETFHARKSATAKTYVYRVFQGAAANPFCRHYAWHIRQPLQVAAMKEALSMILGTHDFSTFRAAGSAITNPVRTIYVADCEETSRELLTFTFTGSGFLYHMVRNLMGAIVDIGLGRHEAKMMQTLLEKRNRSAAGVTAPPQGLCLQQVYYDSYENNSVSAMLPLDIPVIKQ